jgi:hypothetical protein
MTDDEGLSVREAVEWCGTGVTVREVTRLRHLAQDPLGRRRMSARRSVRPASALRDGGRQSGQHHDQQEGHVEDPVDGTRWTAQHGRRKTRNPPRTSKRIQALAIRSNARPALAKRLQHRCRPRDGGFPAKVDVSRQRDIRMAELISRCS